MITRRAVSRLLILLIIIVGIAGGLGVYITLNARERGPDPSTFVIPATDVTEMQPRVGGIIESHRDDVRQSPDSAAAWGELGAVFDAHELFAEAQACFEYARLLDPEDFRWPYLLAWALERQGQSGDVVLKHYDEAATLEPSFGAIHYRRGEAFNRLGRYDEAVAAFRKAQSATPNDLVVRRTLAQTLIQIGEVQQSIELLNSCENATPGDRVVLVTLARAHALAGNEELAQQFDERSQTARDLLALTDPVRHHVQGLGRSSEQCLSRARGAMRAGDWDKAIENFEIVLESRPNDAVVLTQLGEALYRSGTLDLASIRLRQAISNDDTVADAHSLLGEIQTRQSDYANAGTSLERAIQLEPEDALHLGRLAMLQLTIGDTTRAGQNFDAASRRGRLLPHMDQSWGNLLMRSGQHERAAERFRTALELRPNDPMLHFRLGTALEQTGDVTGAVAAYQRSVQLDSNSPAANRLRALGR